MMIRQLERISRATLDRTVVATSDESEDDVIEQAVHQTGAACFRGALQDVLDRYYRAAREFSAEHVIRLTADCPLIDPALIDRVVATHVQAGNDYTSNTLKRTFPDGMDVEVLSASALECAWKEARTASEREHVTPFLSRQARRFKLGSVENDEDLSRWRLTVDFPQDLALIRRVYEALYPSDPQFSFGEIRALLEREPELARLNAAVNPAFAGPAEAST